MTSPLLLEHFDELISTPEDVEKLNNSILQLAMQGKLVEQENGNWSENDVKLTLAKEIQDFIAAGKITKPSKIIPISESDIPVDKPNNWLCIRLGECLGLVNGRAYKQSELLDNGTPVIRIQNLNGGDRWYYSDLELPPEKYCDTNDLLFAWSASFGPYIWEGSRAIFHYHIWKIELTSYIDKKYAYFLLKYLTEQVRGASHGLAMLHITKEKMENWVIVLPPLVEQKRIVTRVEELFAQARRLAEELANSRRELDRLNESALARLLASETQDEFNERWGFIAEHFDLLTSVPEHIAPLRQSILELAVRGKLTRREAGDESAGELLKRIKEEKGDKEKLSKPVGESEKVFELPNGWEWARLIDLGQTQTGSTPPTNNPDYYGNDYAFVKPADITENAVYYSQDGLSSLGIEKGRLVKANSVMMVCIGGSIGKVGFVDRDCSCNQQINVLTPSDKLIRKLLYYFLKSPYFQNEVLSRAPQTTLPILSKGKWEVIALPVPPLAEQERIVKRVEQLLSLCDALEARLQSAEEERGRLVAAVMSTVGG